MRIIPKDDTNDDDDNDHDDADNDDDDELDDEDQNGHNSANFRARSPKFCVVVSRSITMQNLELLA